jgi:hypothetical protein
MSDETDGDDGLEMSERQRAVLERGGDLEVSDETEALVADVLDDEGEEVDDADE